MCLDAIAELPCFFYVTTTEPATLLGLYLQSTLSARISGWRLQKIQRVLVVHDVWDLLIQTRRSNRTSASESQTVQHCKTLVVHHAGHRPQPRNECGEDNPNRQMLSDRRTLRLREAGLRWAIQRPCLHFFLWCICLSFPCRLDLWNSELKLIHYGHQNIPAIYISILMVRLWETLK